jgi:four helix bundle protein
MTAGANVDGYTQKYEALRQRTKAFALRVLQLVDSLPPKRSAQIVGGQLANSGTSVGANYRSACRARSHREFVAKLGIVLEEADESVYWIEVVMESGMLPAPKVAPLLDEANQITAIMVASLRTARANQDA